MILRLARRSCGSHAGEEKGAALSGRREWAIVVATAAVVTLLLEIVFGAPFH